ncbi:uncharacterized protein A1O9_11876 [Exophiala aquamarina CBS 119918]|uniref:Uncharacterized protein n=1 Tax=Exophiala aquamarina CBS 119918 TaxID=1182545 RepID=A0A072NWT1_9EURO|nr:uncharacterized protein A1O9_11876 [Exophiala aquamarina CBS 119918]KEF51887.1 hypothetical protein A1O9_11876 [Exophiala aquamarina CBS 119918]
MTLAAAGPAPVLMVAGHTFESTEILIRVCVTSVNQQPRYSGLHHTFAKNWCQNHTRTESKNVLFYAAIPETARASIFGGSWAPSASGPSPKAGANPSIRDFVESRGD